MEFASCPLCAWKHDTAFPCPGTVRPKVGETLRPDAAAAPAAAPVAARPAAPPVQHPYPLGAEVARGDVSGRVSELLADGRFMIRTSTGDELRGTAGEWTVKPPAPPPANSTQILLSLLTGGRLVGKSAATICADYARTAGLEYRQLAQAGLVTFPDGSGALVIPCLEGPPELLFIAELH